MGVSVYWPLSAGCLCVISNQSTSKKYVYDLPLSQRNRTIERTVGVGDVGEREVGERGGGGQNLKNEGSQYRGLHKIGG